MGTCKFLPARIPACPLFPISLGLLERANKDEEDLMLKVLGVLLLVIVGVAGLGFYLGWFNVKQDGRDNITINVNETKIKEDEEKVKKRIEGAVEPTNR